MEDGETGVKEEANTNCHSFKNFTLLSKYRHCAARDTQKRMERTSVLSAHQLLNSTQTTTTNHQNPPNHWMLKTGHTQCKRAEGIIHLLLTSAI